MLPNSREFGAAAEFARIRVCSRIRENSGPLISTSPNSNEFGCGLLQLAKVLLIYQKDWWVTPWNFLDRVPRRGENQRWDAGPREVRRVRRRPIQRWTLRELLNGSDRICRDVIEHLNTDYVPAIREMAGLLSQHGRHLNELTDKTVVNSIDRLERAETYGTELIDQLAEILRGIQTHAEEEVERFS